MLQGELFALHAVLKGASKLRDVLKERADNASAYWRMPCDVKGVCIFKMVAPKKFFCRLKHVTLVNQTW